MAPGEFKEYKNQQALLFLKIFSWFRVGMSVGV